jgi:peptide-methionine (S)-S-oxide reductase
LDGHSETVQIDYDPTRITYEELLEVFWDSHDPTRNQPSQYMSIVFYHNEQQSGQALMNKERQEQELGQTIVTEIIPFSEFHLAEDYHQKHYLGFEPDLLRELQNIYPDIDDFIYSTAVARVNGYAGGYGDPEILKRELDSLGLSEAGRTKLLEIAGEGLAAGCPVP